MLSLIYLTIKFLYIQAMRIISSRKKEVLSGVHLLFAFFSAGKSVLLLLLFLLLIVFQNLNVGNVLAWVVGQPGVIWSDDQVCVFVSRPVVIFVVHNAELVGDAKNGDAHEAKGKEEIGLLVKALADLLHQLLPAQSKKQHLGGGALGASR